MNTKPIRRGFTLVEILVVVILLGILAAMVLPKFANAGNDAKRNSLLSSLQAVRGQIELYMLQHGDKPPAITGSNLADLTKQTAFSGENTGPVLTIPPVNPITWFSAWVVGGTDHI